MKIQLFVIKVFFILACTLTIAAPSLRAEDISTLLMATTTSTDNTGLLDYLAPYFTKATGIDIRWTAAGTGKALALGKSCDVDVLLVHAPDAEKQFVAHGYGINRQQIMYNDFIIIGPASDPAGIMGLSANMAMSAFKNGKAGFISRGDDSGTHKKELFLWQAAGLPRPEKESWYIQTGQGMLPSINIAAERSGYILTDRGTYLKYAHGKNENPPLVILVQGDESLRNQYSIIEIDPGKCPNVKSDSAKSFSQWMAGAEAQQLINEFTLMGRKLFIPNAGQ